MAQVCGRFEVSDTLLTAMDAALNSRLKSKYVVHRENGGVWVVAYRCSGNVWRRCRQGGLEEAHEFLSANGIEDYEVNEYWPGV